MSRLTAVLCLLAAAPPAASAADVAGCRRVPVYSPACFGDPKPACRPIPYAAAPCFSVRGRLDAWNGAPTFRLHPFGTNRLLGVLGGDADPASASVLPDNVRAAIAPAAPGSLNPVEGAFTVCPLAADKPGWMRPVCIESATALKPLSPPSATRPARRSPSGPD